MGGGGKSWAGEYGAGEVGGLGQRIYWSLMSLYCTYAVIMPV